MCTKTLLSQRTISGHRAKISVSKRAHAGAGVLLQLVTSGADANQFSESPAQRHLKIHLL